MATFSIDIKFDDSYFKKLGLKGEGYEDALDTAVDHTLDDAENTMRREAPIDTGNLRRSISKFKPGKCQGQIHSSLHNPAYWIYIQYGTQAHAVKARKKPYLKFKTKDGKWHSVKEVKIPARAPNPFVTRTARKVAPRLTQYVHEELKNSGVVE